MVARILVGIRSSATERTARRMRVTDRLLEALRVSRSVSGCPENAREISTAVAALDSRYAIAGTRKQDEGARIPQTRTTVLRVDEVPVRYA